MGTTSQPDDSVLSESEIRSAVGTRLEKYRGRSLLEQFALFMGMAQLMESALKAFYSRRYGVELESLERWTHGQVKGALSDRGLRPDFVAHLQSIVGYRNHMAHGFMADAFTSCALFQAETRFESRELEKGAYELEHLFVLFEWTEAHDAWGADAAA